MPEQQAITAPPRKSGDRKDARFLGKTEDPLTMLMPLLYTERCHNEAYTSVRIDLTNLEAFLAAKNATGDEFKYTIFHCVVAAALKCFWQYPKMNIFIKNKKRYMRNEVSAAFVVKTKFSEKGTEEPAYIRSKPDDNLESIHELLREKIYRARTHSEDSTMGAVNAFAKLPYPLKRLGAWGLHKLDKHGWLPDDITHSDPYHASIMLSNVGSFKMNSGYHHLMSWGTNSFFILMGVAQPQPFFKEDGTYEMRKAVDLGITIDERIADGYYYAKVSRYAKYLLEHPETLELPLSEPVEWE